MCGHRGIPARERVSDRCHASGQSWTSAVTLSHGRNGLRARRMAVLSTLREPSLGRHLHREFMRSAGLDLLPIIPATACHQRNDIERYSRYKAHSVNFTRIDFAEVSALGMSGASSAARQALPGVRCRRFVQRSRPVLQPYQALN